MKLINVDKDLLIIIMYSILMATTLHKNSCPGGHEIYNFAPASYYYALIFSQYAQKNICKEVSKCLFHYSTIQVYGNALKPECVSPHHC